MTTVLCTLYNSLYLDKGLVLYDSLCESAKDFKLYVLCMDDKCYDVLRDLKQEYHIPVKLSEFEAGDEELLAAKANRSMGEYCWTCSSSFIRYILNHYKEDSCTYIDADMYFYNDPQVLIDEMLKEKKSVMVVPHRFPNERKGEAKLVGEYCVEFNTFLNNTEGNEVLEYWRKRCLEGCSCQEDGIHWGDQKYLEELVSKFNCVHVCKNPGAGIARWNVSLYLQKEKLIYKPEGAPCEMVFYHYQGVTYFSRKHVSTNIKKHNKAIDYRWIRNIYSDYFVKLDEKKEMMKQQYNVDLIILTHPAHKQKSKGFIRSSKLWQWLLRKYMYMSHDSLIINI